MVFLLDDNTHSNPFSIIFSSFVTGGIDLTGDLQYKREEKTYDKITVVTEPIISSHKKGPFKKVLLSVSVKY